MSPSPFTMASAAIACLRAAATAAPKHQTLDHLRADLSHEMAAKLARLAGFLCEWREGRFRDDDARDAAAILGDITRLHRRHARVAAGSPASFAQLVRVIALAHELRRSLVSVARASAADAPALGHAELLLSALTAQSRRLVETLSARYGARFGELVGTAAEEIRREAAAAGASGVPVVIDSDDGGVAAWVPRADAARWSDLLRNFIRNAVQAAEERRDALTPPAVVVRLRPAPDRGGACVEVLDEGVGMDAGRIAAMWRDGNSRHGDGHGQGLTEAKRAFLEKHAHLEVRSVPQVGTCIRIELPPRDIAFRPPRRRQSLPLMLPLGLSLVLLTLLVGQLRRSDMESIRITDDHLLTALDHRGHVLWQHEVPEHIRQNWRSVVQTERGIAEVEVPPLIVRDDGNQRLAIVATAPTQGPGQLFAFDSRGHERWAQSLRWTAPDKVHTGKLNSPFQANTTWNGLHGPIIILSVRDDSWGSTSVQFITPAGDPLGEYLHPGTLEFIGSGDFDGDGRVEVLLNGKNNDAPYNAVFWSGPPLGQGVYGECLVMLETPDVGGQAFPYTRWSGIAAAREEAYLLIPPLREAYFAFPDTTQIVRIPMGAPDADSEARFELFIQDGRIYELDGHLRPLSCGVGDNTDAARLAPTRTAAPLLYFRDGVSQSIDLIVKRGS
jgi:signal transduction histidine kinase